MFYENLIKLCKSNGISLTTLITEKLKMSSGNITKWKTGNVPKSSTVKKIADYFGVSIDYLLTGEEDKKKTSSEEEDLNYTIPARISIIGERLLMLRVQQGLSQPDLAKRLNVSIDAIEKLENKKLEPSASLLIDYASYFGVDSNWILGLKKVKAPIMGADVEALVDENFNEFTPEQIEVLKDLVKKYGKEKKN